MSLGIPKMKIKSVKNKYPFYYEYHDAAYIVSQSKNKLITLRDKPKSGKSGNSKSVFELNNDVNEELVVYKVDGGIIVDNNLNKCDYAIYTEKDVLILIELKGSDLRQALLQLESSLTQLLDSKLIKCKRVYGRIVLSRCPVPNIMDSEYRKILNKFKALNGNFKKKSKKMSENLSDL